MKVPGKFPLLILVGLTACTWFAVGVVVFKADSDFGFFKPLSLVAGALALALAGFDRWIWRLPGVRHLLGVPDLNGTWHGELRPLRVPPRTRASLEPKSIVVVIRQSFTSVTVRTFTDESSSLSVAAGLVTEGDKSHLLTYVYLSEPKLSVQDRSRVHHGGVKLAVRGHLDKLNGSYWTDRDSKGEISVERISREHASDFEQGRGLASSKASDSDVPADEGSDKEGDDADRQG